MDKQHRQSFSDLLRYSIDKTKWVNPNFASYQQQQWLSNYHNALAKLYKSSDFAGISDANQQENIALADIYVKERFTKKDLSQLEGNDDFDETLEKTASDEIEDLLITFDHEQKPSKINQSAVIIGAAGSGKSTLVKMLAVACSGQADQLAIAQHFGRRLMMPFILREMQLTEVKTVNDLLAVWAREFERKTGKQGLIDLETVKYFLQQGWGVVAFDGVDEIGIKYRRRIRRLVYAFKATYSEVAVFVTGRPVGFEHLPFNAPRARLWKAIARREGWKNVHLLMGNFPHKYVRPFDILQVTDYVTAWYKTRYDTDKVKQETERDLLLNALKTHTGLKTLKYRPIYLATLTYVHDVKGKLPNSQVLAYESMVDAYLEILDKHKRLDHSGCHEETIQFDRLDKWKVLEWLAHDLHHKKIGESGTEDESPFNTRLTKDEFKIWLRELIESKKLQVKQLKINEIDELLQYFLARSGLLVQPEEGILMFSHLSFQEFLVGSWVFRELGNHAFDLLNFMQDELFDQLATEDTWHPVGLSFFGLQAQKQGGGFQFQVIEQLWLKEEEKTHTSFNFINRVLKEGEHTLTTQNLADIWESYWNYAVVKLDEDWVNSFHNAEQQWGLWQQEKNYIEDFLQPRLTNLDDQYEYAANELILLSTCPKEFLSCIWQQQQNLAVRWQAVTNNDKIKYSLDLHAVYPEVQTILKPAFSLEEILLINETGFVFFPLYQLQTTKYKKLNSNFLAANVMLYHIFYLENINLVLELILAVERILKQTRSLGLALDLALSLDRNMDLVRAQARARTRAQDLIWIEALERVLALIKIRGKAQNLNKFQNQDQVLNQTMSQGLGQAMNQVLGQARTLDQNTYEIINLWIYQNTTARCTPSYFTTPQQAIDTLKQIRQEYPEFTELFNKGWFPYQRLKELAKNPPPVEPIEANTHRLYHYLRYKLDQAGEDISDLPENLDLKAGDSMRQWHGDEVADQYIKDFISAGWDGQMPPHDVDRWIKEDQALEAKQKAEKDQES